MAASELRLLIQHDRPTFSKCLSNNFYSVLYTVLFEEPKQCSKLYPQRNKAGPSLYFREETDNKKEGAINIATGVFSREGELEKHQKPGLGVK
jgi:hypothetical protein